MILKFITLLLLFVPMMDLSSFETTFPRVVEKRINKRLDKYFEHQDYHKQEFRIEDSLSDKSNSYFYKVTSQDKSKNAIMVMTIANGCRIGGCDVEHEESEEFEQFYLFSLFDESGRLIELRILDYQSEYGYQVTSKWWLKLFIKNWKQSFYYGKNIDAISGATVSVKSMIREMNLLQKIISQYAILEHSSF